MSNSNVVKNKDDSLAAGLKTYRFFIRAGAKPHEIIDFDEESARAQLDSFIQAKGGTIPASAYKVQIVGEDDLATLQGDQKRSMDSDIAQAQSDAQSERDNGIEALGRGFLRATNPNLAETYERTGGNPSSTQSVGSSMGDIVNALSFGLAPKIQGAKALLGFGAMNELQDIAQQNRLGDIDPTRTAFGTAFNFVPIAGNLKKPMQDVAVQGIQNSFLPSKALMNSPNPPDFKRMLDEQIFSGFRKYSGLKKLQEKMKPAIAELEMAKKSGSMVDIEQARKFALKQVDELPGEWADARTQMRGNINDLFDAEAGEHIVNTPAVVHDESQFKPVAYETERRAKKGEYRKAHNKWLKGDGNELPPHEEVPNKFTVPFWEETTVTDAPAKVEFLWGLPQALKKKTNMQSRAFERDITKAKPKQKAEIYTARGVNEAIRESSPEAREAMAQMAPYKSVEQAMEDRAIVGGSNPIVSLKDWMAAAAAASINPFLGPAGLLGRGIGASPFGMQKLYNMGERMPNLTKAINQTGIRWIPSLGGENEN